MRSTALSSSGALVERGFPPLCTRAPRHFAQWKRSGSKSQSRPGAVAMCTGRAHASPLRRRSGTLGGWPVPHGPHAPSRARSATRTGQQCMPRDLARTGNECGRAMRLRAGGEEPSRAPQSVARVRLQSSSLARSRAVSVRVWRPQNCSPAAWAARLVHAACYVTALGGLPASRRRRGLRPHGPTPPGAMICRPGKWRRSHS